LNTNFAEYSIYIFMSTYLSIYSNYSLNLKSSCLAATIVSLQYMYVYLLLAVAGIPKVIAFKITLKSLVITVLSTTNNMQFLKRFPKRNKCIFHVGKTTVFILVMKDVTRLGFIADRLLWLRCILCTPIVNIPVIYLYNKSR